MEFEEYLREQERHEKLIVSYFREHFPDIMFNIERIEAHGPKIEVDSGITARLSADDGHVYLVYIRKEHKGNFFKERPTDGSSDGFIHKLDKMFKYGGRE